MDNSIAYTNCVGETVEMRIDGTWHYGDTDLHDYEWGYDTVNDRVAGFRREPRDFTIEVMMAGGSVDERNRATDVFERDVAEMTPGTLRVGGSELRCWVTSSSKSSWWFSEGIMGATLSVHADDPVWTREAAFEFKKVAGTGDSTGLDYPFDYPFDYSSSGVSSQIASPFPAPSACRITVYGPAVSPYVIIAGNRYQVDATVPDGGLLVVDGLARTITVSNADGQKMNAFSAGVREDGANVFAKVPAGTHPVSWGGAFGFDVALIEERSEPAWA